MFRKRVVWLSQLRLRLVVWMYVSNTHPIDVYHMVFVSRLAVDFPLGITRQQLSFLLSGFTSGCRCFHLTCQVKRYGLSQNNVHELNVQWNIHMQTYKNMQLSKLRGCQTYLPNYAVAVQRKLHLHSPLSRSCLGPNTWPISYLRMFHIHLIYKRLRSMYKTLAMYK